MSQQYFAHEPDSKSRPAECDFSYRGQTFHFVTDSGVFSRGEIDFGTRTLLEALPPLYGRVLDLGCGFGAVGISTAKCYQTETVLSDVNTRALSLAKSNAERNHVSVMTVESDGLSNIEGDFDFILTNPPIRAGKDVIYRLFQESAGRLKPGGALFIVIRKQQGAQSAERYLRTLFLNVEAVDKSGGFWVLKCTHEGEER